LDLKREGIGFRNVYVVFYFQALWRCLHNTPDSTANVAFRVLGKFGGSNRKMLPEAQRVILYIVDVTFSLTL